MGYVMGYEYMEKDLVCFLFPFLFFLSISTKLEKSPFWFFLCTRDAMDDPLFLLFQPILLAILREIMF